MDSATKELDARLWGAEAGDPLTRRRAQGGRAAPPVDGQLSQCLPAATQQKLHNALLANSHLGEAELYFFSRDAVSAQLAATRTSIRTRAWIIRCLKRAINKRVL